MRPGTTDNANEKPPVCTRNLACEPGAFVHVAVHVAVHVDTIIRLVFTAPPERNRYHSSLMPLIKISDAMIARSGLDGTLALKPLPIHTPGMEPSSS